MTPPDELSPPRSSIDEIIELYKRDVDRSLLRAALNMTPDQRVRRLVELTRFTEAVREAGKKAFR
jgi:hypothetical protein